MMLYKNMKTMVCSPDSVFFDIVTGVLQVLAPCLLMKLVDQFSYCNISSTKSNVNICIRKYELLVAGCHAYGNLIFPIKKNGISSKLWLWQYYCMVAPPEL